MSIESYLIELSKTYTPNGSVFQVDLVFTKE